MFYFHPLARPISVTSLYYCFSPTYPPSFYFDGERHDFWECVCVLEGEVGVAEDEKIYTLSKNNIIFHAPGEFHRIWSANGTSPSLVILSFRAEGVGTPRLAEGVFTLTEEMRELLLSAAEIAEAGLADVAHWQHDTLSQQMLSGSLERMMLLLLQGSEASLSETSTPAAQNYKAIVRAMNENIHRPLSIAELARLTHLSEANLKKCFRRYSGMGVMRYFTRLKMARAAELIREGYTMGEVSDALGYASQNYFSTTFKREQGVSPLKYKKTLEE